MNRTPDRSDRYEEDPYFREERDDPNEMDREDSLGDCLLEMGRLVNDLKALTIRPKPREFWLHKDFGRALENFDYELEAYVSISLEDIADHKRHEWAKFVEVL